MDFLNHREGGMVFYGLFYFKPGLLYFLSFLSRAGCWVSFIDGCQLSIADCSLSGCNCQWLFLVPGCRLSLRSSMVGATILEGEFPLPLIILDSSTFY
jgi:hypothetical protein